MKTNYTVLSGRRGKIPTKVPYEEFEEFIMENPGMTQRELAEIFGLSLNRISMKMSQFNRRNAKKFDCEISQLSKDSYKEGYRDGEEKGFLIGAGLGVGIGDMLKENGIGISDLIAQISKMKK